MGLIETQRALARLYLDGPLRDAFLKAPNDAAAALGLTEAEARDLARRGPEIAAFARSLLLKRAGEAGHALPYTPMALGSGRYRTLFLQYGAIPASGGTPDPQEDARRFVRWLCGAAKRREIEPWIVDLARYEAAWLEIRTQNACCLVHRFGWAVHRWIDVTFGPPPPGRFLGIWMRIPPGGRPRHLWLGF